MNSKTSLSSPHMGGNELKYIYETFKSNDFASLESNVNGFEEALEKYLNKNVKVTALSSGTSAVHLALIQCGVERDDEVICQSMTSSASANPIVYLGANPIFVDSEIETWNICPILLEQCIKDRISKGKKPKAIIAVHIYGMPFKIDEIITVASKYNIPIIENAAEALGSSYKSNACGTFGNFGIFSFDENKIITTSTGGALVCKNKKTKDETIFLATQAQNKASYCEHTQIGFNYRMNNINAAIGRGQMQVLNNHISTRRAINEFYENLFADIQGVTVFTEPNKDYFSNHWLSVIIIDPVIALKTKEDLRLAFLEENIESIPVWKPMHLQPVFKNNPYYGGSIAEDLFSNGLCLPSGSNLTDEDKNKIKKIVHKVFKNSI